MYINQLVDLAIQRSLRQTLRGLASQMGVSSSVLSQWRQGNKPIPDDRIQQLARIAKVDAGEWMVLIRMEAAPGDLGREWRKLAIRLGVPLMALCVAVLPLFLYGSDSYAFATSPAMYIMFFGGTAAMLAAMVCGRNSRMMIC